MCYKCIRTILCTCSLSYLYERPFTIMNKEINVSSFKQDVATDIVDRLHTMKGTTITPYDFSEMVDSLYEKAMLTGSITEDVQITRSRLSRYLQNNDEFIKDVEKDFMNNHLIYKEKARFQTVTAEHTAPKITFSKLKETSGIER